jgi:hypothetical protein
VAKAYSQPFGPLHADEGDDEDEDGEDEDNEEDVGESRARPS